jgi:hypothetical protein
MAHEAAHVFAGRRIKEAEDYTIDLQDNALWPTMPV